jgi:hypothetical protein
LAHRDLGVLRPPARRGCPAAQAVVAGPVHTTQVPGAPRRVLQKNAPTSV